MTKVIFQLNKLNFSLWEREKEREREGEREREREGEREWCECTKVH